VKNFVLLLGLSLLGFATHNFASLAIACDTEWTGCFENLGSMRCCEDGAGFWMTREFVETLDAQLDTATGKCGEVYERPTASDPCSIDMHLKCGRTHATPYFMSPC
jgi:hypothetical protein